MKTLFSTLEILVSCVGQSAASSPKFSSVVLLGLVVAALAHWACFFSMRLWNVRFHMDPIHHLFCAFAGIVTLCFVACFFSLAHLGEVVHAKAVRWLESIDVKQVHCENDKAHCGKWPDEQTTATTPNPCPTIIVPTGLEAESSRIGSGVISKYSIDSFNRRFPILRWIMRASNKKCVTQP